MSTGPGNKVNTSTQVEYSPVEPRSIVGQEDIAVGYLSTNLGNLSLGKESKGIRPPLVGQASSSSNDSVSLSFETRFKGSVQERPQSSPTQTNVGTEQNKIGQNDSVDSKRTFHFLNRSDYVNQKPPEGSYLHVGTSLQPAESYQDFTRVRSSSSASSVTSSRPLEWDNGADVGYDQCRISNEKIGDPSMSTVDRIALVSSSKLLRRSDPEGTTGGTCQQVIRYAKLKSKVKNRFGHPNAESTPLGTYGASVTSTDTDDFISPIPCEKREESEHEIISSESEASEQKIHKLRDELSKKQSTLSQDETFKAKIPLFPELGPGNYIPSDLIEVNKHPDGGDSNTQSNGRETMISYAPARNQSEINTSCKNKQFDQELNMASESVEGTDMAYKKLSSSLENVSNIASNTPPVGKIIPSTLPRSQSQTNINPEIVSHEIILCKESKSNVIIQNLFKNKSASSSSVATVVHRKGDSPKHVLVQTSVRKNQSVGTQISEKADRDPIKCKPTTGTSYAFIETPHLPKPVLSQHFIKKSNYFDFTDDHCNVNNAVDDQLLGACRSNENCKEKELENNNFGTHFHNGVICRGAHKKKLATEEPTEYKNHKNSRNLNNIGQDSSVSIPFTGKNQSLRCSGGSANLNRGKIIHGGLIDSVESSVKSGGFGTDKQYSVTVEDRVNSFEYLPGHVYENNERQQPINSCGTSSMSIENQTSNNATPEHQNKIWESSGCSMSSTFEKDAQRGVDILSDFVKGTYEDDTLLKRKLTRRVIDKLISKNHIGNKTESYRNLMKNTPWVPPRPANPVERSNVKNPKSKVPCEISSHSEKSGTTNTSSECFIPRPLEKSTNFSSFLRDEHCQKYQGELSSTSNVTSEKAAKHRVRNSKPLNLMDAHKARKKHAAQSNDSSVDVSPNNNWKEPATKTEKLIEERRKAENESSGSHSSVAQLLDMERENQLFWIRSEIEHLNNLKQLLERQEELKRGLRNIQRKQSRPERSILKEKNRMEENKTNSVPANADLVNKKSSLRTKSSQPPKLGEWLNSSVANRKSHNDLDGWVSHHYENDENIKSCMKRKSKHQVRQRKTGGDFVIYDEPPSPMQRGRHNLGQQKSGIGSDSTSAESTCTDGKDHNRRNVSETVRAAGTGQRGEPRHECQCLCQGKCQCCNKATNVENKKKEPLGYYIIFDNPKTRDKTDNHQLEEVRISCPMGEQKRKPERQRAGADNVKKKELVDFDKRDNNVQTCDTLNRKTEATNSESEDSENVAMQENKKPVFKAGAGELQYHLLHNRPSYVSRAEDRRQCIAQMQYLRELSSQNKRRLLTLTQPHSPLPPPIKVRRVFSQHKMRQMTEKKYRQLSEVKEKLQDTKKKEGYRTNRLMAEVFKKNLQKRVLKGEVNLSNSVFVISSL